VQNEALKGARGNPGVALGAVAELCRGSLGGVIAVFAPDRCGSAKPLGRVVAIPRNGGHHGPPPPMKGRALRYQASRKSPISRNPACMPSSLGRYHVPWLIKLLHGEPGGPSLMVCVQRQFGGDREWPNVTNAI
jgi:hypothetical protein